MTCRGCWREVPTTVAHDLDLCAGCLAWLRLVAPGGLDGSEGANLARRMLGVWSDAERWDRRCRDLERLAAERAAIEAQAVASTVVEA